VSVRHKVIKGPIYDEALRTSLALRLLQSSLEVRIKLT